MLGTGLALLLFLTLTTANECLHFDTNRSPYNVKDLKTVESFYQETLFKIGKYVDTCGYVYFISDNAISDEMLLKSCKELNMTPLILEDAEEMTCLVQEFEKGIFGDSYFWVPAIGKRGDFKWCHGIRQHTPLRHDDFQFSPLQTKQSNENSNVDSDYEFYWVTTEKPQEVTERTIFCLQVQSENFRLILKEQFCATSFQRFICKVKRDEYINVVPGDKYQNLGQCTPEIEKAKIVQDAANTMQEKKLAFLDLENFSSFAHSACGNFYFVNTLHMNWKSAMKECCKYGLKPLKFETLEEMNCFTKALAGTGYFYAFWVGAFNSGNSSEFKWLDESLVNTRFWAYNQPERPQVLRCATINVEEWQIELTGLQDTNCEVELPVVCKK